MNRGYLLIGGLTAIGAMVHYFLWSAFPDAGTARAALLMWVTIGVGHLVIYAIRHSRPGALAAAVVIPALIRLLVLPGVLVGLAVLLAPDIKTLVLLFVGGIVLFMGLELMLAYQARAPRSSS